MSAPSQLRNIQLLRALAAISVVVQHALHDSDALTAERSLAPADHAWLNFGFGVDIFFVISGFIMAHTMAEAFGRPGASLRFLGRRVARVVPLYWVLTSVLLIGALVAPGLLNVPVGGPSHILASYLFIPDARLPGEIRPVLALGWTLNYEMYFYVLFALALLLPLRLGAIALTVVIVALAAVGAIARPDQTQLAYWTDPIILDFLFGIHVALLLRAGVRLTWAVAAAAALLGTLGFVHVGPLGADPAAFPRWLADGVPAALLVGAAALAPSLPLGRLVAAGVALGDASYSLYLIHPFVVRPLRAIGSKVLGAPPPAAFFVLACCLLSGLLALLVRRLVEQPLTALGQRLLDACSKAGPAVRPLAGEVLDRDVSRSNRSRDMNVIDPNKREHDVDRKPVPTVRHHARNHDVSRSNRLET